METVPPPDSAVVLNGWKEIASYLGRSARSAQRWEHELGLPIHRMPTPDGGAIVYAVPMEVDAWRARRSGEIEADAAGNGVEDPERLRWWQTPLPFWAVVLCVASAAGTGLLVNVAARATGVVATWEYEGRALRAFTEGGRPLWSHDFARPVSHPITFARGPGHVGDVDGDGVPESLVPIRYAASAREITNESDAVAAFAADGRLLWSVQPVLQLQADGEIFEGPWRV